MRGILCPDSRFPDGGRASLHLASVPSPWPYFQMPRIRLAVAA